MRLSTGTEITTHQGIIGIDEKLTVFGGYDSIVFERGNAFGFDDAPDLTASEQVELADMMIARWESFKAQAEKQ